MYVQTVEAPTWNNEDVRLLSAASDLRIADRLLADPTVSHRTEAALEIQNAAGIFLALDPEFASRGIHHLTGLAMAFSEVAYSLEGLGSAAHPSLAEVRAVLYASQKALFGTVSQAGVRGLVMESRLPHALSLIYQAMDRAGVPAPAGFS